MTALMQAVKSKDAGRVKELIRQGVNVSELDANGDAPLVMAAYEGLTEIVRLLLEAGADVTAVDPGMKATALHAAAYAGRTEAAKLLIQYKVEIDKQGPYNGYTALHDAIWQGHVETARVIVEAGANLNLKNHQGQTPLEFARARGNRELVALLEQKLGNG
jgi:ankyrin repeat protein